MSASDTDLMAPDYKPPEYKRQMDQQLINELRAQREEHNRYYERFDRVLDIMSDLLQENKQHMKRYEKQEEAIFGKNGLVIEVDRLIQDNKKSKWFWALSIAAFLQAVIAAILKSIGMKFLFAIVLLLSSDLVFAQTRCLWCPSSPLLDYTMVGNGGRWQSKLLPSNCTIQWDPVTREFGCGSSGAPSNATYVVMSLDGTLTNERVLTAGTGLDLTDGGAGGNATLLLEPIGPQTVLGNPLGGSASPTAVGVAGGLAISGANLIIDNNGVTDAKLRDSAGFSVIGRSAATSGDPADITGVNRGEVLRIGPGPTLGFGAVELADSDAVTGVLPAGNFEGYDRVQEETANLTRRRTVNFTGSAVTCADNAGTSATDCTITGGGGGCPWTYVMLSSDFSTTNATPTSVTGLDFTPSANVVYVVEGQFFLQSTSATVGSRPGIDWPSAGVTDNIGWVQASESGTADNRRYWDGTTTNSANTASVPNANVSTYGTLFATMRIGGSPSGTFQVTLESETAGTSVSIRTGSWIRYKEISNGVENCSGDASVDVQIFTSSGTWTKPAGAQVVQILAVGGGGGGGSGQVSAAGANGNGGGGGGGGAYSFGVFDASALGASCTAGVGTGGAGGAAITTDSTIGLIGTVGGGTFIQCSGTTMLVGRGGQAGNPGTGAGGGAGGGDASTGTAGQGLENGTKGGNGGASGSAGAIGIDSSAIIAELSGRGATGGGGGGSKSTGGATGAGSRGGNAALSSRTTLSGGTGGTAGGGACGNGNSAVTNEAHGGSGGGGTGGSVTTNSPNACNGGSYGGGGGGSGGVLNGFDSGAGGAGANGILIVITHF